jgi:guanylate kinase
MRKIIFCIVGGSGSGKTMLAEALEKYAGINLIQSYTDRPRRTPDEIGHTFLEKSEFDLLKPEEMLAFTNWNGFRYCCLEQDLKDVNSYVIDCSGLEMLRNKFKDKYHIASIRIHRPIEQRVKYVGVERVARDADKFYLPNYVFDCVIRNETDNKLDLITEAWQFIKRKLAYYDKYSESNCGIVIDDYPPLT